MNEIRTRAPQPTLATLDAQLITEEVLLEKYAKGDERTADDIRRRVARALAQAEAPDERAHGRRASSTRCNAASCRPGRISSAAGTALRRR